MLDLLATVLPWLNNPLTGTLGTLAVQALLRRQRAAELRKTHADAAQSEAATGKLAADTLTARFAFYEQQLDWMAGRITALETRASDLETELQNLHAAIDAEPAEVRSRIRGRLRKAAPGATGLVITGPTTINGGVAGDDIGTIQKGA